MESLSGDMRSLVLEGAVTVEQVRRAHLESASQGADASHRTAVDITLRLVLYLYCMTQGNATI